MGRFRLLFVHPLLFQFGRLILPTFGFLAACAAILFLLVSTRLARSLALDPEKIWIAGLLGIVTALAAGKVPWQRLHVTSHAAMEHVSSSAVAFVCTAVAVVAASIYIRRVGLPWPRTADAFAPGFALGSSVLAIACLEAGCDYGTPSHLPWAVIFRNPAAARVVPLDVPLHPTQIYSSLADFALFVLLLWLLERPHNDGEVLGAGLFLGGITHYMLNFLRGDQFTGPVASFVSITQIVTALMVLAGGLLWVRHSKPLLEAPRA